MDEKRPNTKGLISRRFRRSQVEIKIIDANSDEIRTRQIELINKGDPVKAARERVRLAPGEMIYRTTVLSDQYILVVMTPEEFLFRGRILEYTPSSTQRKDETP